MWRGTWKKRELYVVSVFTIRNESVTEATLGFNSLCVACADAYGISAIIMLKRTNDGVD